MSLFHLPLLHPVEMTNYMLILSKHRTRKSLPTASFVYSYGSGFRRAREVICGKGKPYRFEARFTTHRQLCAEVWHYSELESTTHFVIFIVSNQRYHINKVAANTEPAFAAPFDLLLVAYFWNSILQLRGMKVWRHLM